VGEIVPIAQEPLVFPDVEQAVAEFVRARPELSGVPVGTSVPPGFDGTQRAVVLTRLGGVYLDDDRLDNAEVRLDSYGPDKTAAHAVALAVRGVLPILSASGGTVFPDVTELQGPCFVLDRRHSDANRYVMRYRFVALVVSRPA